MRVMSAFSNFIIILFFYISAVSGASLGDYFRSYSQYRTHDSNYMLQNYRDIAFPDISIRNSPVRNTMQDIPLTRFPLKNVPHYNPLTVKTARSRTCWYCPIKPIITERSRDILVMPKPEPFVALHDRSDLLDLTSDTVETDNFWIETLHSNKQKDKSKKKCDDDNDKDDQDDKHDKDKHDDKYDKDGHDKKHDKDDHDEDCDDDDDDDTKKHDKEDEKKRDKDDEKKSDKEDKEHEKKDHDKEHEKKDDLEKELKKEKDDKKDDIGKDVDKMKDDKDKLDKHMNLDSPMPDGPHPWQDHGSFNEAPPPDASAPWSSPDFNGYPPNGPPNSPPNGPPNGPLNGPPNGPPFNPGVGQPGPPSGMGGPDPLPWQMRPFNPSFNQGFPN